MKKLLGMFLVAIFLMVVKNASAEAIQFPACQNYSGTIQAQYDSGSHAIVGDPNNEDGSDTVYDLQNGNFMQCFCPATGDAGIQTNWQSTASLSDQEQQDLIAQGWVPIEHGDDWGLEPNPYLAQNSNFSCGGNPGNTGGTGGPSGGSPSVCNDTAPQDPYITGVQKLSPTSVLLTWEVNPNTNNYTIVYGTSPDNYQYGVPATGNVTSYTISNLDPNAHYYFAVRAVNGCAPSDLSNQAASDPQSQVLGASALAPTGSEAGQLQIFAASVLSLLSLGYGIFLKKNSKI